MRISRNIDKMNKAPHTKLIYKGRVLIGRLRAIGMKGYEQNRVFRHPKDYIMI